jgi:hypothetical protein
MAHLYTMEFPITKERLQKYRENEAVVVETRQRVATAVKYICKDIERIVLTSNEHTSFYQICNSEKYGEIRPWNNPVSQVQVPPILDKILDELRTLLPDSKITVDPLETYILIDWR